MKKTMITKALAVILAGTAILSCTSATAGAAGYNVRAGVSNSASAYIPFRPTSCIGTYRRISSGYINPNIGQAVYAINGKQLIVRKAKGSTGMVSSYPGTYRAYVSGCSVLLRGTNQGYLTAEWTRNGYSYSMSSNTPLTLTNMTNYITAAANA